MKSFKEHRFEKNPIEKIYVDEFIKEHSEYATPDMIVFGANDRGMPRDWLSEREKDIVVSTIQWLGSPAGKYFVNHCNELIKKIKKPMNLQLSLTRKWFGKTEAGIKPEDYRLPTAYWCNRFLLYEGKVMPKSFWKEALLDDCFKFEAENLLYFIRINIISFQKFTTNIMTLGYPSKTDESRILRYEHAGIEIRTGNPALGAEPNKLYFVIKHGKRIK